MSTEAAKRSDTQSDQHWIGEGLLRPQHRASHRSPAYRGTLRVSGAEYELECWWVKDGAGHRCLSFSPNGTRAGVLWPTREKLTDFSSDFYGLIKLDGRTLRLRAWGPGDGDELRLMVKP